MRRGDRAVLSRCSLWQMPVWCRFILLTREGSTGSIYHGHHESRSVLTNVAFAVGLPTVFAIVGMCIASYSRFMHVAGTEYFSGGAYLVFASGCLVRTIISAFHEYSMTGYMRERVERERVEGKDPQTYGEIYTCARFPDSGEGFSIDT